MEIQPQLFKLGALLQSKLFRIPDYQRAYSWGKRQRGDLFRDIDRVKSSDEDHFMATVVGLARRGEDRQIGADHFSVVEVVDGQQRLTTLILLLKAIQKELEQSAADERRIAEELSRLLVKDDQHTLLLLQTNHDTSHIFSDYVRDGTLPISTPQTSADKNVVDAIVECELFVSKWKTEQLLVELVYILRNRLWAIFYILDDEGAVYRVFEVLNSRGLDVASIDKLKSQLMGLVFERAKDGRVGEAVKELHRIWQDIYRTLGTQKIAATETLRFAATLKASADSTHRRPLDEQRSLETLGGLAGSSAKQVIDCGRWLLAVVSAEDQLLNNHRWRAVTRILQARLVAVAILLREFPKADESSLLRRWERVSFRIYGLACEDARTKVGEYTKLAWSITNEKLSKSKIMDALSEIGKSHPISKVIELLDQDDRYDGWTEELRYFFYRYDEHLAKAAGQRLNETIWNRIWEIEPSKSIEHVKPQSSRVSYVNHLGNLMLLPPGVNSSLGDLDPTKKADTYEACGLQSSLEVARLLKKDPWTKSVVETRAKKLLLWAREEWRD